MKKNLIAACATLAFVLSAATVSFAAEAPKAEAAGAPLYSAKCPSPCDFGVKSHDKQEVVDVLKQHAKAHHDGMVLSDADANGMVKVAGPKK